MKKLYILLFILTVFLVSCYKNSESVVSSDGGVVQSGKAGSMAKFAISNNHLFLINENSLIVYNLDQETNPVEINKLEVDFGIETVYTLKEKLFIGSIDGVYIYDITDPKNIIYLSNYQHITSCDPVVANDSLAFSTLNSNSMCRWQNGANQLDIIDIENVVYPQRINSVWLKDPKGLALDSTFLFVCNGERGVKIYDFSNPLQLQEVSGIVGINAYDIILRDKVMILVGKDGLFQYDYSDLNNIKVLSNINF